MFIRPITTKDVFNIEYNNKNYTIEHTNNKYYITINGKKYDISAYVDANGDFLVKQLTTFIDTIAQLTKPNTIKYYVEFSYEGDCTQRIQSKWFNTEQDALDFYKNMFDHVDWCYDVDVMYAEYDEETDTYGDIELLKHLR